MNNKLPISLMMLIIATLIFGCGGSKKENKNNAPAGPLSIHAGNDHYFAIDTTESTVIWKGSNTFGSHTGYVHISKGELRMEDGQLTGGAVEINMNTIEDETHMNTSGLIKHLKNEDFFDVTKFPVATIVITKVAPLNMDKEITADLTIKGITQPITFNVKTEVNKGIVKVSGRLVIDRTDWGIRYKSGKFYNLLADKTISDSIVYEVRIMAGR